uniref:Putative ixodes 8-cys protein n=1 Tax=Ixodes ricinus TaxID=34613 RepID=A0A0K8R9Q6_IXORI
MFKLKFFILCVLAVLCFGNSSASETDAPSSNSEAANNAGESETSATDNKQEESKGETSVSDSDTAARKKSKAFEEAAGLPPWIINATDFLNILITNCHESLPTWETISNKTIDWDDCTYICKHDSSGHKKKLPENTPCGLEKKCEGGKCVQQPTTPATLPSCR